MKIPHITPSSCVLTSNNKSDRNDKLKQEQTEKNKVYA